MCRAMYLLTEKPLSAAVLAWEEAPGVSLRIADPQWIPEKVQAIPHGTIYQVYSSEGCGCGFESSANLAPELYTDEPELQADFERQVSDWQANMQGLERLLRRVVQEQPEVQLCTGWDFEKEVTPRRITVGEMAGQQFDVEWDWLKVTR